jgi:hypothetical protein
MAERFAADSNILDLYRKFTGDWITQRSGGKIKPMTPAGAAGFLGSTQVETGSPDLSKMDVVETGNNQAGRGISQFSHARRGPYDKARSEFIKSGGDVNTTDFQAGYLIDEYQDKHNPSPGALLSSHTKAFDTCGQMPEPVAAAKCWTTGSEGRQGYFAPSTPHMERRTTGAQNIFDQVTNPSFGKATGPTTPPTSPLVKEKPDPYAGIWVP